MAYQISWLVEGRVIHAVFTGELTIEEVENYGSDLLTYLDSGTSALVHVLVDTSQLEKFPVNLRLLNTTLAKNFRHPKIGWSIIITSNRTITFLSSMLTQI